MVNYNHADYFGQGGIDYVDTEIYCKDTNISPELMEYLVKILNKADIRRDFNWGRRIRVRRQKSGSTYNPIDELNRMCYNIGV